MAPHPCPFWIDQLCHKQDNDVERRKIIASIPQIYSTLNVVALMPGSLCKCLKECLDTYRNYDIQDWSMVEVEAHIIEWQIRVMSCWNSTGFCSYFNRLWTRQEMLYAGNIHVEWTDASPASCVPRSGKIVDLYRGRHDQQVLTAAPAPSNPTSGITATSIAYKLSPFARQVFNRSLSIGDTHDMAMKRVDRQYTLYLSSALIAMRECVGKQESHLHSEYAEVQNLSRFLTGRALEKLVLGPKPENYGGSNNTRELNRFIANLGHLGEMRRSTKHERDYVLAVWVDCPGYRLPSDYKTLKLHELLDDAIRQVEKNYHQSFPVMAIAGLFDRVEESALWRPSGCLADVKISSSQQVYGTVLPETSPIPLSEAYRIPLRVFSDSHGRCSNVRPFDKILRAALTTVEVIECIREITAEWPGSVIHRVLNVIEEKDLFFKRYDESLESQRNRAYCKFQMIRKSGSLEHSNVTSEAIPSDFDLPYDFIYDCAFELVCDALGMDFTSCRRDGALSLVVHCKVAPCIGFISNKHIMKYGNGQNEQQKQDEPIAISRDLGGREFTRTVIEAVQVPSASSGSSEYQAIGIWVPNIKQDFREIQAVVHADPGPYNSWLI